MATQTVLRNRVLPRKASKYKNRKSGGYDSKRESKRARELNIPVVTLAQVNREAEKRTDKRPPMPFVGLNKKD